MQVLPPVPQTPGLPDGYAVWDGSVPGSWAYGIKFVSKAYAAQKGWVKA